MSAATYFLLSLLLSVPFYYLLCVPYEPFLPSRKQLLGSAFLCLIGLGVLTFLFYPAPSTNFFWLDGILSAYTLISGLAFLYFNVSLSLPKLLCNLFIIKCYLDAMNIFMELLREVFASVGFLTDPVVSTIFTDLFLLLLTAPSIIYYQRNLFTPLLEEQGSASYWRKLWFIPGVFWILFAILTVTTSIRSNLSEIYLPERFTSYFIWTLGTFMSFGILLQLLRETGRKLLIAERLRMANLHLLMQRKEYGRLQNVIDLTRKQRHDMRQQLSVIKGLAEQRNLNGIRDYVDDYLQTSQIESSTILCENYALNALMQYYVAQAHEAKISTDIVLDLPSQLPLPESDVASILGNLVENALHACNNQKTGHKFINVKVNMVDTSMIAMTVRNSYSGMIIRDGDAFISTKREGRTEGIGIASIRSIALQYGGMTKFTYNKNIFQASVLLTSEKGPTP